MFLLYSNMSQLYVYLLPLKPPSHPIITIPLQVITEHHAEVPVLCSSLLLARLHDCVYTSVLLSQFVPPSPSLLTPMSTSPFSTSASLYVPCK